MMSGKIRYSKKPDDTEGLRDSQGNLEPPEDIHLRLYGLSLEQKKDSYEFPHHFAPELNAKS